MQGRLFMTTEGMNPLCAFPRIELQTQAGSANWLCLQQGLFSLRGNSFVSKVLNPIALSVLVRLPDWRPIAPASQDQAEAGWERALGSWQQVVLPFFLKNLFSDRSD
jgi:hypothetical protein